VDDQTTAGFALLCLISALYNVCLVCTSTISTEPLSHSPPEQLQPQALTQNITKNAVCTHTTTTKSSRRNLTGSLTHLHSRCDQCSFKHPAASRVLGGPQDISTSQRPNTLPERARNSSRKLAQQQRQHGTAWCAESCGAATAATAATKHCLGVEGHEGGGKVGSTCRYLSPRDGGGGVDRWNAYEK